MSDGHTTQQPDRTEFPPPTAPTPTAEPAMNPSDRWAHPANLFVLTALIGGLVALIVGVATGAVIGIASASSCAPTDDWCGLGALIIGAGAGILAGSIAYVVAGVTLVRRHRPPGARAVPILLHLAVPIAILAVGSTLLGLL